jgi:hypothetical protein
MRLGEGVEVTVQFRSTAPHLLKAGSLDSEKTAGV